MKIKDDLGFILVFLVIIGLCVFSFLVWLFGFGKYVENKIKG